jgi:GH15 family glucan-1,4-alpha-glucosidase
MPRIQDYAIIGDCRSSALVSNRGSIDWLSWPRFDSPAIFAALLDEHRGGRWSLAPAAPFRTTRRYIEDTNVLETRFETDAGALVTTDFMPARSEEWKRHTMTPDHEIVRVVRCERGEFDVDHMFDPKPGFGERPTRIHDAGALGLRIDAEPGLLVLRTDMPRNGADPRCGRTRIRAGETWHFSLTFSDDWPAILPPLGEFTEETIDRSIAWWRAWTSQVRYHGPARGAVVRSALALRLLMYAPSGAVIAAATTSLPERVGGDLNWDYRFCWLRDASFTVRALLGLGFRQEAEAFVSWLLHATRLTQPRLSILYDVHGRIPKHERTLDEFDGYAHSRPVRIGNSATEQLQLDVYGEVIHAAAQFVREGGDLDWETGRLLTQWCVWICKNWQRPDEGIWEPRSGKRHNTHSRLLAWTALDTLLDLDREVHLRGLPREKAEENRALIRREIEERAWNAERGSYASTIDGSGLDATLLLLPWYGFESAASQRMRQTYESVRRGLGAGDGLLCRYRTGDSPGEGAFGICGFWAAEFLALGGGTSEEACVLFERLCRYANDVGLFAEEIDPRTGDALGNFPQAFTHVGLINAALTLERRLDGEANPRPVPTNTGLERPVRAS